MLMEERVHYFMRKDYLLPLLQVFSLIIIVFSLHFYQCNNIYRYADIQYSYTLKLSLFIPVNLFL